MIGKQILHYRIIEKIGQGGMGVVYLAEDSRLRRKVAIKFLPPAVAADTSARKRFEIEAQSAAALNHPNIATIYAIEEADNQSTSKNQIFLVMEYIQGQELKSIINNHLSINNILNYALQIGGGLQAAHNNNIVHRDIKSSNIMVSQSGEVKIMDFGLAVCRYSGELTGSGTTIGTAAYMSPEQAQGKQVDERTDIWAFGVVLYEMLTAELPFQGDYEQAIIFNLIHEEPEKLATLPYKMADIVKKMLAKNPEQRFKSMEEVIKELKKITIEEAPQKKKTEKPSIAVLPFTDMSPAKDQDYFCEGVAEEILNSLNKISGLHVVSRTFSFQVKKEQKDVREIGKLLNVKSVLEGSVRKSGNMLRINVQLTNVADGFYLWSNRYDRELDDIFAIQDDIAENVATELGGVLSIEEKEAIRHSGTAIAAYELFLKGRMALNELILEKAQELFEEALKIDPNYVPCLASLAESHCWSYEWQGSRDSDMKAAYKYSQRALDLGPDFAESHVSRGYVLSLDNKYIEAEKEFSQAIKINPYLFEAYYLYGRSSFARGEIEKSVELFRKASQVNREDFQSVALLAQSYTNLGLSQKAMETYKESVSRSEYLLNIDPVNTRVLSLGAPALYFLGQEKRAFEWMDKAVKLNPENQSVMTNYACLLAVAGKKEEAIDVLEKLYKKGYGKKDWVLNDPDYDTLRDHPRFIELLKKLK